jgi:hypothetical protein
VSKKRDVACRLDLNPPTKQIIAHQLRQKNTTARAKFSLHSFPLYFVEELDRLLA